MPKLHCVRAASKPPSKLGCAGIIQLSECTAQFTAEAHDEYPDVLENLSVTVSHPAHGEVASVVALRINRFRCGDAFLELLDEESDELHQFSVTLFDKFGKVRPSLVEEGQRKGTGCWGRELNSGHLIYLLEIDVKQSLRGTGLGSWTLQQFTAAEVRREDFIICWPCPTGGTSQNQAQWEAIQARQIGFFRKNDFRRIGRTNFFGYSPDPTHPSRRISSASDADSNTHSFTPGDPELTEEQRIQQFPLHYAIASIKDASVIGIISAAYEADPSIIHKADGSGFTPIYVAAGIGNLFAASKLIEAGVGNDLLIDKNADGMNPLEKLQERMRSNKEFSETLLGRWDGYSEEDLLLEVLIKRAMMLPLVGTDQQYMEQRKWGCTCGSCAGGWLSPRMRFRLQVQAGLTKDNMSMSISGFQPRQPLSREDIYIDGALDYIPAHLRQHISKTFYKGYQTVFTAIHIVLTTPDTIPFVDTIMTITRYNSDAGFYFGKGGKVEYALDAVTHDAKEQSLFGDGTFEALWEDEAEVGRVYTELRECANDLEFPLVRRKLGLDPAVGWGPYYDSNDEFNEDDAMLMQALLATVGMPHVPMG